jgi:SAM-dependent methyltransferase
MEALKVASVNLNGLFVRADVEHVELCDRSVDIILVLDVLMYLDNNMAILHNLLKWMRPGGRLLLHEKVRKPSLLRFVRRFLPAEKREHVDIPNVEVENLLRTLQDYGRIEHLHRGGSPVCYGLIRIIPTTLQRPLRHLILGLDSLWCATVGLLFVGLGDGEIQIVFQREPLRK